MKRFFLIMLLILLVLVPAAFTEDFTGCWVVRQTQGQVLISRSGDCYKFTKESFYRGELNTDSGVLDCKGQTGEVIYKNGMKTRIKREDDGHLCENSIEDWVRVDTKPEAGSFDISGTWVMDGGKIVFTQKNNEITGQKFTRGKQISEYSGLIRGRMISLKEHHLAAKKSDSYHQMAILEPEKILMYFGWNGDTYLTRQ